MNKKTTEHNNYILFGEFLLKKMKIKIEDINWNDILKSFEIFTKEKDDDFNIVTIDKIHAITSYVLGIDKNTLQFNKSRHIYAYGRSIVNYIAQVYFFFKPIDLAIFYKKSRSLMITQRDKVETELSVRNDIKKHVNEVLSKLNNYSYEYKD